MSYQPHTVVPPFTRNRDVNEVVTVSAIPFSTSQIETLSHVSRPALNNRGSACEQAASLSGTQPEDVTLVSIMSASTRLCSHAETIFTSPSETRDGKYNAETTSPSDPRSPAPLLGGATIGSRITTGPGVDPVVLLAGGQPDIEDSVPAGREVKAQNHQGIL